MSRKQWRWARALRVLLACVALWVPARAASASFGPADAVVMLAGRAGTADIASAHRDTKREARVHARTPAAGSVVRQALPLEPLPTVNRTVIERRYLRHCALLC